jgi:hypothetical protein
MSVLPFSFPLLNGSLNIQNKEFKSNDNVALQCCDDGWKQTRSVQHKKSSAVATGNTIKKARLLSATSPPTIHIEVIRVLDNIIWGDGQENLV